MGTQKRGGALENRYFYSIQNFITFNQTTLLQEVTAKPYFFGKVSQKLIFAIQRFWCQKANTKVARSFLQKIHQKTWKKLQKKTLDTFINNVFSTKDPFHFPSTSGINKIKMLVKKMAKCSLLQRTRDQNLKKRDQPTTLKMTKQHCASCERYERKTVGGP